MKSIVIGKLRTVVTTKRVLIGLGVLIVVGAAGWVYRGLSSSNQTDANYQTTIVEQGTLMVSVTAAGQVTSDNSTSVDTSVTGVITRIYVENGQEVKSGDKLAEVELDQASQQAYSQALASYQSAKNNLESAKTQLYSLQASMLGKWDTYKELSETDDYADSSSDSRNLPEFMIPQNEWLAAEATYKQQQSVIAQAQTNLNNAWLSLQQTSPIIYAPISGTITGFSLQPGSVIASQASNSDSAGSQRIASIVTQATPTIDVDLTEVDVTKVSVGDKATVTVDALPDKTFTGQVVSVDTMGAVSSGVTSYPAVIRLDTMVDNLLPNMTAEVAIVTETKTDVMTVPSTAVQSLNGTNTVTVIRDGQPQAVIVETGISSSTETEIVSGLSPGDEVVASILTATAGQTTSTTSPFSGVGRGGFGGVGQGDLQVGGRR